MSDIYNMKLHEVRKIDGWGILRVAGGWIYNPFDNSPSVFVPYNDEFSPDQTPF